jgi:hypothetical protein
MGERTGVDDFGWLVAVAGKYPSMSVHKESRRVNLK